MWKRIVARYPVWYESRPLACYRIQSASQTSRLIRTGANVDDERRSIETSRSYLPEANRDELSRRARAHCAQHALWTARRLLGKDDISDAAVQIREAIKTSHSLRVVRSSVSLLLSLAKRWVKRTLRTLRSSLCGRSESF